MDGWIFRFVVSTLVFSGAFLPMQKTFGIGDTHLCSAPLGMQNGRIPDSALSASSFYVNSVGAHHARLNTEVAGGAWCPKGPISIGVREWLQVSFNESQLLTGIQMQGRFGKGRGLEFTEEFELEYWREGFNEWRKYYRFDGKTVLPGNSDTSTVSTNRLRPPLIAKLIRVLPYSTHRRTVCLRIELLGCPFRDEILQYTMVQGDTFLEGISLRDESYDGHGGKWDRKVDPISNPNSIDKENVVNIFHQIESFDFDLSRGSRRDGDEMSSSASNTTNNDPHPNSTPPSNNFQLTDGLGQLTDKIEGANSFTMDIGYGLGNGWVGWRQKSEGEDYVQILVEFTSVRNFSSLDVFINNYPSKGVQVFSRAKVYFSIGGVYFSGKGVTFIPVTDVTLEHARNLTIPLEGRLGRFLRLHLYYRSTWLVLGELYFHSEIYDGNCTEEMGPDTQVDFSDTRSPLEIRDLDSSTMETVIGIMSGLLLLLGIAVGLIIWMRRNGGSISAALQIPASAFPFWRSNHWNSVPTHIVTTSNPTTEGVKDLLLTLTPLSNGVGGGGGGTHQPSNLVNSDFKAHNPPPYTNGSVSAKSSAANGNHANGLQLQGSHHNNYGSTKKLPPPENSMGNGNGSTLGHKYHSPTLLTLRSNRLANLDEPTYEEAEEENSFCEETSTLNPSRTKNRKIKIAGGSWNLGSGERSYKNHRGRLVPEVSLRQLRLIENLGSCLYGQVHLYDFEGEIACHEGTLYRNCRLIAKTIKSVSEIRLLSVLDHEHVLEMIGVCSEMKKPLVALFPAPECGDLCSFLSRLTSTPSLSWLLSVGAQIASGMNYLESLSLIHRDLAARNCLVEREGSIRISDLAMACEQYRGDYCCHTSRGLAPLRWWSWESVILTDDFTMQSSVWSFGVTLWEILTLCRQKPLAHVPDHQITALAENYGSKATNQQVWLPQPLLSPPEIFDLMRECWQKNPNDRPTFQHIHLFLDQKCTNTIYHVV